MTRSSRSADAGQAFPIYIMVVAGLLFLALAYLAVGQAGANRNGAQTAADAAALAAALDTRDQLTDEWTRIVRDPTKWQAVFHATDAVFNGCGRADQLAAQNNARRLGCGRADGLLPGYTVRVETTEAVGDSIVPGTENLHAKATATAVIEPACTFELPGAGPADAPLPTLSCDDGEWHPDPEHPADLPGPEDLFDVHLAD
ncbi:pilus assembly protein TadG-related protein [Streptomyces sp. IBSBF 2806]|uniref:pilus assembly protein TadG-related protein n=1 Tax=Streptomyces sp. IBSBF 2806 TaxID=2903529 RepID=UPI002FDBE472